MELLAELHEDCGADCEECSSKRLAIEDAPEEVGFFQSFIAKIYYQKLSASLNIILSKALVFFFSWNINVYYRKMTCADVGFF